MTLLHVSKCLPRGQGLAPALVRPEHLKIEPDHVLADMLRAMHLIVNETRDTFEPEGGAYGGGHGGHGHSHHGHEGHAHSHGHSHDHDHSHGHDH